MIEIVSERQNLCYFSFTYSIRVTFDTRREKLVLNTCDQLSRQYVRQSSAQRYSVLKGRIIVELSFFGNFDLYSTGESLPIEDLSEALNYQSCLYWQSSSYDLCPLVVFLSRFQLLSLRPHYFVWRSCPWGLAFSDYYESSRLGYEGGPDGFLSLLLDACNLSFSLMGEGNRKAPTAGGIFLQRFFNQFVCAADGATDDYARFLMQEFYQDVHNIVDIGKRL